ncbi:MAG TPA: hypothetical protein VKO43_05840 [Candidatus Krumholzibacteriaceae bacterium]|nr:hypothetical protein [Candidatus Krumholzibacteriaceae bacterium]
MKKINPYFLSLLSALALILFTSGCYTILNHPRVETEPQNDYEYYSCSDCHGQNAYFGHYYPPLAYPGMWHDYYIQPWWYGEIDNTGEQDIPVRSIIGDREIRIQDNDFITNPGNIRGGSPTAREVRKTDTEKSNTNSGSTKDNRTKRIKRSERKARESSKTRDNNDSRDNNKDRSGDDNRR